MSGETKKFLIQWLDRNIHEIWAYQQPTEEESKDLAEKCLADANDEGISPEELDDVAFGDLEGYIHSTRMEIFEDEVARVREKD